MLYVANVAILYLVFRNTEVWQDSESKDVTVRKTLFSVIPLSRRLIRSKQLSHLIAKRSLERVSRSDVGAWPNFTAELVWHDNEAESMIGVRSVLVMQRNQQLSVSVKEAKQIASQLGIKFHDGTQVKSSKA